MYLLKVSPFFKFLQYSCTFLLIAVLSQWFLHFAFVLRQEEKIDAFLLVQWLLPTNITHSLYISSLLVVTFSFFYHTYIHIYKRINLKGLPPSCLWLRECSLKFWYCFSIAISNIMLARNLLWKIQLFVLLNISLHVMCTF